MNLCSLLVIFHNNRLAVLGQLALHGKKALFIHQKLYLPGRMTKVNLVILSGSCSIFIRGLGLAKRKDDGKQSCKYEFHKIKVQKIAQKKDLILTNVRRKALNVSCETSNVSRLTSNVSCDSLKVKRRTSNANHDAPKVNRRTSNASRDAPKVNRRTSNASHDAPKVNRQTSNASRDSTKVSRRTSNANSQFPNLCPKTASI
jgi:hypothetical protein